MLTQAHEEARRDISLRTRWHAPVIMNCQRGPVSINVCRKFTGRASATVVQTCAAHPIQKPGAIFPINYNLQNLFRQYFFGSYYYLRVVFAPQYTCRLKQSFDCSARTTAPAIAHWLHSGLACLGLDIADSKYSGARPSRICLINYVFFIDHAGQASRRYIDYFWLDDYFNYAATLTISGQTITSTTPLHRLFLAGRLLQLRPPHQLFLDG